MADIKITNLPLGTDIADDDQLLYIDVSDTTAGPLGTDKRILIGTARTALETSNLKESRQNREAIEAVYKAQGYNNVFFFEDGFTYTESNDVGIYEDGTAWTYADAGALPVTVAAGTVPSEGVYKGVKTNNLQQLYGLGEPSELDDVFIKQFNSIANMTSYSNLSAGGYYSTGGTTWVFSGGVSGDLNSFKPLGKVYTGDFRSGVASDHEAIQAALNVGGDCVLNGDYTINSSVEISNDDSTLEISGTLNNLIDSGDAIKVTGARCRVSGGVINSPGIFNGSQVQPSFGVVNFAGEFGVVDGVTFNNVPKICVFVNNINNFKFTGNTINGNLPENFFTGSNTLHCGIAIDAAGGSSQGNIVITSNIIRGCVQGGFSGNYGAGSFERAFSVSGNVFEDCQNHGWYTAGLANGHTIVGNSFSRCQVPVALTGDNHVVDGNTMQVQSLGDGNPNDIEVTGISLRNPIGCIVSNNTIKGSGTNNSSIISLSYNSLVPSVTKDVIGNIISGNTINIENRDIGVNAISLGSADSESEVKGNIISGNTISSPVRANQGSVMLLSGGGLTWGNKVNSNIIEITGAGGSGISGVYVTNIIGADITNNSIVVNYNSDAVTSNYGVAMFNCENTLVDGIRVVCADNGGNVNLIGVREFAGCKKSEIRGSIFNATSPDLLSFTGRQLNVTSGSIISERGFGTPQGVEIGGVGSTWLDSDGSSGSVFWVKESGISNSGWVGK